MINPERYRQLVIASYLADKLNMDEKWFETELDILFGATPMEVILRGDGEELIGFLEERLGLRQGSAF